MRLVPSHQHMRLLHSVELVHVFGGGESLLFSVELVHVFGGGESCCFL